MNPKLHSMYCLRCGREFPVGDHPLGCPDCAKEGHPSSLSFCYTGTWKIKEGVWGMRRYSAMLPYEEIPTLGEGNTPVVSLPSLAKKAGVKTLWLKNEFQNPTGSHKDRMNPFIVARAVEGGYERVTAASSGNEGASLGYYAAAANIPCTIVTTASINPIWKAAIEASGAELKILSTPAERWQFIRERVEKDHWFSATNFADPPVGSCAFGIQGYKTISYEIYEQTAGKLPAYILIPVARGDLLWGIYEGFADLKKAGMIENIPRLVAVEPFNRLENTKSLDDCVKHFEGDGSKTPSIGGDTVTVQSYLALEKSKGFAVSVGTEKVEEAIQEIGRCGIYLEASSALAYNCLKELTVQGKIPSDAEVMLIATSHGYKNKIVP